VRAAEQRSGLANVAVSYRANVAAECSARCPSTFRAEQV